MIVTVTFTEAETTRIGSLYEDAPTDAEWGQWAMRRIQEEVSRLEEQKLRGASDAKLGVDVAQTTGW